MNKFLSKKILIRTYLLTSFTFGAYEFHNNYINQCNPKNLHYQKYYFTNDVVATSFGGFMGIFPPTLLLLLYCKMIDFEDNLKYNKLDDKLDDKCEYKYD